MVKIRICLISYSIHIFLVYSDFLGFFLNKFYKFSIIDLNFWFLTKKFGPKIRIWSKISDFVKKIRIWSKISDFVKNFGFCQKNWILSNISKFGFGSKLGFCPKIRIGSTISNWVKNFEFGQKIRIWSKMNQKKIKHNGSEKILHFSENYFHNPKKLYYFCSKRLRRVIFTYMRLFKIFSIFIWRFSFL